jgi:hypothetical protein
MVALDPRQITRYRRQGVTYDDLSDATGIADVELYQAVSDHLAEAPLDSNEEMKLVIEGRLEMLMSESWNHLQARKSEGLLTYQDIAAVGRIVIDACDRLVKIRGLDAPIKQVVQLVDDETVLDVAQKLEAMAMARGVELPQRPKALQSAIEVRSVVASKMQSKEKRGRTPA